VRLFGAAVVSMVGELNECTHTTPTDLAFSSVF